MRTSSGQAENDAPLEVLTASETAARLPYGAVADALLAMLQQIRDGQAFAPPRQFVPLGDGDTLLIMPATDGTLAITKLVTIHHNNRALGLPVIQGEVLVMDARTGRRLCILDGRVVTARRTAALSLLAARLLAPHPDGPLLIVGAGTQAHAHLEAFVVGLGVREVYIAARTPEHAHSLAAHGRSLGVAAEVVSPPATVLDRVSLIVTATSSTTPVLDTAVREDAFIAAIGAYRPDMTEVPASLVRRAHLYVDTLEGAQAEAGDLLQAGIDWQTVTPLEHVLQAPRPASGPVLFKSVGYALWDLAAARVVAANTGA